MKKSYLVLVLTLVLLVAASGVSLAGEELQPRFGAQFSFPSFGISGIMPVTEDIEIQGVLGPLGTISAYTVRGRYNFEKRENWNAFGYVGGGIFRYDPTYYDTETNPGFEVGGGIEYDWRAWDAWGEDMPNLSSSIEMGIGMVDFDHYNYSALTFGSSIHYNF